MSYFKSAAFLAVFCSLSVSAEPLADAETLDKASYAIGTNLARDMSENAERINADKLLQGLKEALAGNERDLSSYAQGLNMGLQMKNNNEGINAAKILQGLEDTLAKKTPAYPEEELDAAMQRMQGIVMARQQEQQKAQQQEASKAADANKAKGEAFLQANAAKEGVLVTPSGLQYQVMTPAKGDKPKASDAVTVHYTGRLLDGTVFDSSIERGQPASFTLDRVIPGWREGLQLMAVGSKFRFWIPSDLAYGAQGPRPIGPNQVLDFEVELIKIGQ
jgi:FKBP-type peptidyl-prolyl cis-trans isomerase